MVACLARIVERSAEACVQVLLAGLSLALVAIFLLADFGGGGGSPAPQQTAAQARLPGRVDLGQYRGVDTSVFF